MRPHVTGCESVTLVWGGVNAWRSWSRSSSAGVQLTLKRVRVHILPVMFSVFFPSVQSRALSLSCVRTRRFFLFVLFCSLHYDYLLAVNLSNHSLHHITHNVY